MALRSILPRTAPLFLADNTYDFPGSALKVALLSSAFEPVPGWPVSAAVERYAYRQPTTPNGHYYQAQGAGITGGVEPTWPTNGGTVVDGAVTWLDTGLVLPATGADATVFADVVAAEITGTGYTAGGETLAGVSVDANPAEALVVSVDTVWTNATFAARWAVVYHPATLNGAVAPIVTLILLDDTPADVSPSGVDFTLQWGLNGVVQVPAACFDA